MKNYDKIFDKTNRFRNSRYLKHTKQKSEIREVSYSKDSHQVKARVEKFKSGRVVDFGNQGEEGSLWGGRREDMEIVDPRNVFNTVKRKMKKGL